MRKSRVYYFSLVTVGLTWCLLVIGGLVNPMQASMACPDWYFIPTCNGKVFPNMSGGVLYEHGHRIFASLVGMCVLTLVVLCWRTSVDPLSKRLSLMALFLVILQGCLGGITVLLNLSIFVSTLHLVCAMVFFALLISISFRLSNRKPIRLFEKSQIFTLLAIIITMIQLIYGGVVRHMGAGLACGDDIIGCGPTFWPSWFYGQLHMGHRILGYAIFFLVLCAGKKSYSFAMAKQDKWLALVSCLPIAITLAQIAFGLLAIYTVRSAVILALHTGFGALLLASLLVVYLLSLPQYSASSSYAVKKLYTLY
jgi:heme A synthase